MRIAKLQAEIKDIKHKMKLMEQGHLGTSTDHPGYRTLIVKLQQTQKIIAMIS